MHLCASANGYLGAMNDCIKCMSEEEAFNNALREYHMLEEYATNIE